MRLVLCGCKMSRYLHPPTRILQVYTEALMGVQSDISSRWSQKWITFSRLCLEVTWNEKSGQNIHSKDKGRDMEPPIAPVQLPVQPVVTSFWWPLATRNMVRIPTLSPGTEKGALIELWTQGNVQCGWRTLWSLCVLQEREELLEQGPWKELEGKQEWLWHTQRDKNPLRGRQ